MDDRTYRHDRNETPSERADRNFDELLGGLRVALPGVQVLFAFLLIVPFNARFEDLGPFGEKVYFGTLICAALASALLIAPSMHHRIGFGCGDKAHLVKVSNRLTIVGLTFLAIAMTGVVMLVTNFVFGTVTTIITAGAIVAVFAVLWYVVPVRRRRGLEGLETKPAPRPPEP